MTKQITRDEIIKAVYDEFINNEKVHAYWLDGSDGREKVDEYSDIDIVLDVSDGHEEEIFKLTEARLSTLGDLDLNYQEDHGHDKLKQKVYHLKNSSKYLLIDFCIQSHSRDKDEAAYSIDDSIEIPKVLFDKKNVVTFKEFDKTQIRTDILDNIKEFKSRYKQVSRVEKYIKREQYLEASMYYGKYLAAPIVELMRMKYTPKYHYLHLIHASEHLPKEEVEILNRLYKYSSLKDLSDNIKYAKEIFNDLVLEVEDLYNF